MSTRLAARIGIAAEERRAAGSGDVVAFKEPTVGSVLRTKGTFFVVAQVTGSDAALTRAARQVVEWIEHEYYYDLSSGVLVALGRAVQTANRRLFHNRARLGIPARGTISVVAAVVRGSGAHVVRIGPAGGAILRDGRLYEVPPPVEGDAGASDSWRRKRAVATSLGEVLEVEPFSWQGEIAAGDRLALVSRNLVHVVGSEEVRRALTADRAPAAAEELQRLFIERGGKGSDGLLVVEVVEVPITDPVRRLEPVYPKQPLAGLPDESPLPLAEGVGRAIEAGRGVLTRTRGTVSGVGYAAFRVFLAFVPHRRVAYPQRISRTTVRDADRRRRVGALGMVCVALLVAAAALVRGAAGPRPTEAILQTEVAREAVLSAEHALAETGATVGGVDLVDRDPELAIELLNEASQQLDRAVDAGVQPDRLARLRGRVDAGLDRLYSVTRLSEATSVFSLAETGQSADASAMTAASDGSIWVIEEIGGQVLRADPADGTLSVVYRSGEEFEGTTTGQPWLIASAATDMVVLDRRHQAWRIDLTERVPHRMDLNGADAIDESTTLMGALQHRPPLEIFTLYIVDPAVERILKWTPPAVIPVDFPDPPENYLTAEPDLAPSAARDVRIDANLWLLHADTVTRVNFGTPLAQLEYSLDPPPDGELRDPLDYRLLEGATVADRELFYVYDRGNDRIIAFNRADGSFVRQWLAPRDGPLADSLTDVRGLVVSPMPDGPPIAYVLTAEEVLRVVLE